MNGVMKSTTAPDPGHSEIRPIQTAPPSDVVVQQPLSMPMQEAAEVFADDRIVDPIDQSIPSLPTHATMQDFEVGMSDVPSRDDADLVSILQGLLSNMSTDPLAVEKNVSLAAQYLDAAKKRLAERRAEEIREEQRMMEEAIKSKGLGPYMRPLRPPLADLNEFQAANPSLFKDDDDAFTEVQDLAAPQAAPSEEGKDVEPSSGPEGAEHAQGA